MMLSLVLSKKSHSLVCFSFFVLLCLFLEKGFQQLFTNVFQCTIGCCCSSSSTTLVREVIADDVTVLEVTKYY